MLHKSLGESIKDVDTLQGIITGYAAAFNIIDDDQDIILPGAFTKTLAEQGPLSKQPRIKFLYQHDQTKLLGVPSVLKEDSYGLYFEAKLADTQLARDVLTLYAEKIITEHSIGYEVVDSAWDRIQAARLLKQLRLYEFSGVTWGANSQTPVISVKSLSHPDSISALADRAARIDSILHSGNLRSDALCETLDRELKALHTALAPADAGSQPYTIKGVTDSMTQLAQRLSQKAASKDEDELDSEREQRAKACGIAVKDGGNLTCPSKYEAFADKEAQWGDYTNYRYPLDTKAHADNAAARFTAATAREQYTAKEQDIIAKRIMARQKDFDEDPDWWPLKEDGKAASVTRMPKAPNGSDRPRKAMDFATALTIVSADDTLQDEWGDSFQALVNSLSSVMWQSYCQAYMPNDDAFDAQAAAETVLSQFSDAMSDLVKRSIAADFVPELDWDGDSFLDPDGINANAPELEAADGWDSDYKSRRNPQRMPNAPAPLRKSGRAISNPNRQVITDALDGMTKGMAMMQEHHAAIADLMEKTDPDATRQDEDDTNGDDDTENGGTNPNKKNRHAPERHKAATTHGSALSAMDITLDALRSRSTGRKAS